MLSGSRTVNAPLLPSPGLQPSLCSLLGRGCFFCFSLNSTEKLVDTCGRKRKQSTHKETKLPSQSHTQALSMCISLFSFHQGKRHFSLNKRALRCFHVTIERSTLLFFHKFIIPYCSDVQPCIYHSLVDAHPGGFQSLVSQGHAGRTVSYSGLEDTPQQEVCWLVHDTAQYSRCL